MLEFGETINLPIINKTMASIILQVDEEIKTAFERANPEIQKSLTEVMAEISDKAQQRGLTPEILKEILADDDTDE